MVGKASFRYRVIGCDADHNSLWRLGTKKELPTVDCIAHTNDIIISPFLFRALIEPMAYVTYVDVYMRRHSQEKACQHSAGVSILIFLTLFKSRIL